MIQNNISRSPSVSLSPSLFLAALRASDSSACLYTASTAAGADLCVSGVNYLRPGPDGTVTIGPGRRVKPRERSSYLSVFHSPEHTLDRSSAPTWPCRLFQVQPLGSGADLSSDERAVTTMRVIQERPAWEILGPRGEQALALLKVLGTLSAEELTGAAQQETEHPLSTSALTCRTSLRRTLHSALGRAFWKPSSAPADEKLMFSAEQTLLAVLQRPDLHQEHHRLLTTAWRPLALKRGLDLWAN